jgi:hypothetical protein
VACRDPTDDQFLELMHRIHKGRGSLGYEVSVFEVELRPQSGMQCLGMKMTRRGGGRACSCCHFVLCTHSHLADCGTPCQLPDGAKWHSTFALAGNAATLVSCFFLQDQRLVAAGNRDHWPTSAAVRWPSPGRHQRGAANVCRSKQSVTAAPVAQLSSDLPTMLSPEAWILTVEAPSALQMVVDKFLAVLSVPDASFPR